METKVLPNETLVIEVHRKPSSVLNVIARICSFIIGITGILASCVLFITIIGILPGIGLFVLSAGFIAASVGRQKVECPHCHRNVYVAKHAENFECPKCKRLTIVDWK